MRSVASPVAFISEEGAKPSTSKGLKNDVSDLTTPAVSKHERNVEVQMFGL